MKIARLGDKVYGDNRSLMSRICRTGSPFSRDGASLIGKGLRHELMERFSGSNEKKKLDTVFASAPPWFVWFTFGDFTAKALGLHMPDFATVIHCARSKEDFRNLYGLPQGAFEGRPWPNGPENEELASTNLDLLRPAREKPNYQMTRRESRRAEAAAKDLRADEWPSLIPTEYLTMPFRDLVELLRDHRSGTHPLVYPKGQGHAR
jgi:hypothetical protein